MYKKSGLLYRIWNEYKKGLIRRMFVALANIRREEKEEKKQKKAKKAEVQTDEVEKD